MTKDNIFMFTAGVIGGAAGMLIAVKKYYEHIANEEIESVKETYSVEGNHIKNGVINNELSPDNYENIRDTSNDNEGIDEQDDASDEEAKKKECEDIIKKLNYGSYSHKSDEDESEDNSISPEDTTKYPRVITPEEYEDEEETYTKRTLSYFSCDGVIMDSDTEEVIDNGIDLVGEGNLEHFGEYEPEVVYVRNESNKTDYEVVMEDRTYKDSEYYDGNEDN